MTPYNMRALGGGGAPDWLKIITAKQMNRAWTPKDDAAYARMQGARIEAERGGDNITAYAKALRDIGTSGGSPMMGISDGTTLPADDFEAMAIGQRRIYEDYLKKKEAEVLELEAARLKLKQAKMQFDSDRRAAALRG
jgi:hypothetical protein